MNREELGARLLQWHGGQNDPVYAVGSFYLDGNRYPEKSIVDDAIHNLDSDLDKQKRMLAGERVKTRLTNDLKRFGGYTDESLRANVADLEEIISELKRFMAEDY